jgi:HlyD family secretion protein
LATNLLFTRLEGERTLDIIRQDVSRKKTIHRAIAGGILLISIAAITLGLTRLKSAAPTVERATLYIDTVKRGTMLRQVRGTGSLVPEKVQWIPAETEGQVVRVLVLPGSEVNPETVLLELNNSQLEVAARDAQLQVQAAEAEYQNQQARLKSEQMDQQAGTAKLKSEYVEAKLRAEADDTLAKDGLVPDITLKISHTRAEELAQRYELERQRSESNVQAMKAQLNVYRTRVDQARAQAEMQAKLVQGLKVRAAVEGVMQQLLVQVGQRVTPGTNLARVVQPERLKAELKVAETQARDVQIGQPAIIDTRNGVIRGRVSRVDPAVQNGTVTVDVQFDTALPKGARPDLTVDGTIELERLDHILYVGRPAIGQENDTVMLFRIDPSGKTATQKKVRIGTSSVNSVEVLEGLKEGDRVILSDMSQWEEHDQVSIH